MARLHESESTVLLHVFTDPQFGPPNLMLRLLCCPRFIPFLSFCLIPELSGRLDTVPGYLRCINGTIWSEKGYHGSIGVLLVPMLLQCPHILCGNS